MGRVHLNRPLVLEAPERVSDGAGGHEETWAALGTLWAEVRARTGRDRAGEGGAVSATGFRVTVRAAPLGAASRPQASQRFRDGTRILRIEAVAERDAAARFLTCFCEEEVGL
ncbi:head-tail adaptor protein [Roseovarius sp. A21]|uniref:Head-tail adaptor protein n=1 Tax=Roseovarius bejariae TaxID=2576383 RepID=A0A844CQ47_9RHOB|nr:head-tail adaptor protein [Roseovarius bejariae]MRU16977.1 head-tail adaptor protein [Roseovarius bejariae]